MAGVFDDGDAVLRGGSHDGAHVAREPAIVHHDGGAGARRDELCELRGVHVRGVRPGDVAKDGTRADVAHGVGRGDEGERPDDHFVTRPDAENLHREVERRRAVRHRNGVRTHGNPLRADRRQHRFLLLGAVAEREERDVEIHRFRQGRQ